MVDLAALKTANAQRWAKARLTRDFSGVARRLVAPAAKARYQTVAKATGVPWFFIAVVHQRESSQDWTGSLAQGDPWHKVSVHIPAGRGPFASWEDAAIDALVNCPPRAASNSDWSIGGLLTMLERYNGTGYAARGLPSPYVWAGTDQYRAGKFVADGRFSPDVIDQQLGCAGMLFAMEALDGSIGRGAQAQTSPPAPPAATRSFGQLIAGIFAAIFKRRT